MDYHVEKTSPANHTTLSSFHCTALVITSHHGGNGDTVCSSIVLYTRIFSFNSVESTLHYISLKNKTCFQFTKKSVLDAYTAFVRNVKRADEAIRLARTSKPAFDRFLQVRVTQNPLATGKKECCCNWQVSSNGYFLVNNCGHGWKRIGSWLSSSKRNSAFSF